MAGDDVGELCRLCGHAVEEVEHALVAAEAIELPILEALGDEERGSGGVRRVAIRVERVHRCQQRGEVAGVLLERDEVHVRHGPLSGLAGGRAEDGCEGEG